VREMCTLLFTSEEEADATMRRVINVAKDGLPKAHRRASRTSEVTNSNDDEQQRR